MDAPPRGALMLVYSLAAGLIGAGMLEVGLYWGECHVHNQPVQLHRFILPSTPLFAGLVALVRSRSLAKWISDKLDE